MKDSKCEYVNTPIDKGNYSMDTSEREVLFEKNRGSNWPEGYKKYREQWSELPKLNKISKYPLLVDIELSSICNLKCPMCYTISEEFKQKVNIRRMDWNLYKKIIDEIGGNVPAIRLSLRGEATLNKNFIEAIAYAKENGIKEVSCLTHGFKLNLPFFKQISDAGIDWITISIDGVGDTYETIRAPLKFNDLLEKIKVIKQYKIDNNLNRPVIKVQGIWPAIKENPQLYYDTFSPYVDLVAFNPLIDYLDNDEDDKVDYIENFTCPQQYQRLVIGADGLVMKCSNDENNDEVIGNLNIETVYEVWHGEKLNKVRDLHKNHDFRKSSVCRKCYLPRKTQDDKSFVNGKELIVKNYTKRSQIVGT